jgi:pyruvate,water dikinase
MLQVDGCQIVHRYGNLWEVLRPNLLEKGDIIVTTMTSPDLVPSISKSAAIITDLGGRTCHAAIVSREMGIPAIVGTQVATRILRDGQQVTVDAYNGIVYEGLIEVDRTQLFYAQ